LSMASAKPCSTASVIRPQIPLHFVRPAGLSRASPPGSWFRVGSSGSTPISTPYGQITRLRITSFSAAFSSYLNCTRLSPRLTPYEQHNSGHPFRSPRCVEHSAAP
jgi:hypothetical protein